MLATRKKRTIGTPNKWCFPKKIVAGYLLFLSLVPRS
jgi:hypothetical protein